MRVTSTTGATVLAHEGTEYTADETGAFDLPHELGSRLIRFPEWDEEYVALDRQAAAEAEKSKEPDVLAARVADLEERVAILEAGRQKKTAAKPAPPEKSDPAEKSGTEK